MRTLQDQLRLFRDEIESMNTHINTYGQIQKSSEIIKHWHDLDNIEWLTILSIARELDREGSMDLNTWTLQDIDKLIKHIENYEIHCANLLYPEPKITNKLHHSLTNFDRTTTVKRITFKTMMNIREAYCAMQGIDLPNEDSSKGKLDTPPFEELFQ